MSFVRVLYENLSLAQGGNMLSGDENNADTGAMTRNSIEMSMQLPIVVLPSAPQRAIDEGKILASSFLKLEKIDPALVRPSEFNNRLENNFDGDDFLSLKEQIRQSNGNIQPIKVRGVGSNQYEIIFGHRRYRACLELGLPVLAIVESLDDKRLWLQMDQENREQKKLSMFEQGAFYSQAISKGFYKSQRDLALNIGLSFSYIAKCIRVYELPPEIIGVFKSPLLITSSIAEQINEALKQDLKITIDRAKGIGPSNNLSVSELMLRLLGKELNVPEVVEIVRNEKQIASIKQRQGKFEIVSERITLVDIQKMLEDFFK